MKVTQCLGNGVHKDKQCESERNTDAYWIKNFDTLENGVTTLKLIGCLEMLCLLFYNNQTRLKVPPRIFNFDILQKDNLLFPQASAKCFLRHVPT